MEAVAVEEQQKDDPQISTASRNNTLIIGLGYQARQGKGTAAQAMYDHLKSKFDEYTAQRTDEDSVAFDKEVRRYSFAGLLRAEVVEALLDIKANDILTDAEAMKSLCSWAGVSYDPDAKVEPDYPYTKQRALYQWWGTEYRRAQDPGYWVNALMAKIDEENPSFAIIDDVRFPNEAEAIRSRGGFCIKVERVGYIDPQASQHASENALHDFEFDTVIMIPEGQLPQLKQAAIITLEHCVVFHTMQHLAAHAPDGDLPVLDEALDEKEQAQA